VFDVPEGLSVRILAIAIVVPESPFEIAARMRTLVSCYDTRPVR
jgi:hypothetical protein